MENRTGASVLALTLVGLGASALKMRQAARRRRDAVLSFSAASALCNGDRRPEAQDATHRDGSPGDSELLRRFQTSGYVIVEDVFSKEQMSEWKAAIKAHLARWPQKSVDPSTGREVSAAVTGVSVWMAKGEDPSSPLCCPQYFIDELTSPKLGVILRELLGGHVEFVSTKPVLKTGKIAHASPWHQDWPCTYATALFLASLPCSIVSCFPSPFAHPTDWKGTNKLSLWIAIDDATVSNGCLKVVPESHGHVFPHEHHTEAIAFDSRVNAANIADEQMSVPLEAGSVLFFHDLLLHASNPNTNGKDRYCMIPTYRSIEDNDPVCALLAQIHSMLGFAFPLHVCRSDRHRIIGTGSVCKGYDTCTQPTNACTWSCLRHWLVGSAWCLA